MRKPDIFQEPTLFLFKKAFQHVGHYKKYFVLALVLASIARVVILLEPLIFAAILNELQHNGLSEANISYLFLLIFLFFGIILVFWVLHGPSRIFERRAAFWIKRNYQMYLFEKVFNRSLAWHSDRDSGDTLDKVGTASKNLFNFTQDTFRVIDVVIKFVGTMVVLAFFSIWISTGVALVTVISFWLIYQFDKRMIQDYKEMNTYNNAIAAKIYDAISNVVTLLILRITKAATTSIEKSIMAPKDVWWRFVTTNEWKWLTGNVFLRLVIVVPLGFYLYISSKSVGMFEIGTFSALYLYLNNYQQVFFGFSSIYESLIEQKARVQNAEEIEHATETPHERTQLCTDDKLSISNLTFTYETEGSRPTALDIVDLQITIGERIACIGKSGSGKSTILKVIHGMYDTSSSVLTVDGVRIHKQLHEVDLMTTLVPQEPELFSASIRENVTLGLDYTDDEVNAALDLAAFSEVVDTLPNGLESKINERGVNLSGGQKQRLALARALLFAKDKEFILLDESTSSVDPKTEVLIYQNIFSHFKGKTFIANIHKLNLLKYFDRIIILENGKIADSGTFEDLLQTNAEFKKMWNDFVTKHKS